MTHDTDLDGVATEGREFDQYQDPLGQATAISGHLAGVDDEGRILFRADGSEDSVAVSIGVPISDDELVKRAALNNRALVLRTTRDRAMVLVALLRERVAATSRDAARNGVNVKVDGEDVRLVGQQEIELRCGKARLLLRKDGRVEISGTSIVSRSRGPMKIKGATIALN